MLTTAIQCVFTPTRSMDECMMSHIDFNKSPEVYDPGKKDERIITALKDAGFEPNACMQCGMCTASCLSGRWTSMRTRQIMWRAATGDPSVLEDNDIWLCTTCYACYDRCPRDLKVTDAIIELRNVASERGLIKDAHRKTVDLVHKYGHAVPINDKIRAIRKELGLEEVPPTIFVHKDEIKRLAENLFLLKPKKESGGE
ncbi:MAG: CoB--CoM heterodisulfide reductase subunit C [Candidatus Thorarchaeota archaeon]|nr:MAG: CoB--CoM heterodisulfide reductase subunit C [Candidatus Thorarchaeota archaeon]